MSERTASEAPSDAKGNGLDRAGGIWAWLPRAFPRRHMASWRRYFALVGFPVLLSADAIAAHVTGGERGLVPGSGPLLFGVMLTAVADLFGEEHERYRLVAHLVGNTLLLGGAALLMLQVWTG